MYLPASLPRRLALGMLKAHARALGLAVHDDPDSADVMQWLRGTMSGACEAHMCSAPTEPEEFDL